MDEEQKIIDALAASIVLALRDLTKSIVAKAGRLSVPVDTSSESNTLVAPDAPLSVPTVPPTLLRDSSDPPLPLSSPPPLPVVSLLSPAPVSDSSTVVPTPTAVRDLPIAVPPPASEFFAVVPPPSHTVAPQHAIGVAGISPAAAEARSDLVPVTLSPAATVPPATSPEFSETVTPIPLQFPPRPLQTAPPLLPSPDVSDIPLPVALQQPLPLAIRRNPSAADPSGIRGLHAEQTGEITRFDQSVNGLYDLLLEQSTTDRNYRQLQYDLLQRIIQDQNSDYRRLYAMERSLACSRETITDVNI